MEELTTGKTLLELARLRQAAPEIADIIEKTRLDEMPAGVEGRLSGVLQSVKSPMDKAFLILRYQYGLPWQKIGDALSIDRTAASRRAKKYIQE